MRTAIVWKTVTALPLALLLVGATAHASARSADRRPLSHSKKNKGPKFVRLDCERAAVFYDREKLFVGPKRLEETMELKRDPDGNYRGTHHFLMGEFRVTLKGFYHRAASKKDKDQEVIILESELKRKIPSAGVDDFKLVNSARDSSDDLSDSDRFEVARRRGFALVHTSLVNFEAKDLISKGKTEGLSLQDLLQQGKIESGTLNFVNVSCRLKESGGRKR